MLVKDETKYCWCEDEVAGEPQNSIKDAIEDYVNNEYDYGDFDALSREELLQTTIEIGHPYRYVPEIDGERVIWNVLDYNLDDEIAEWSDDYMKDVKNEHMDELSEELTKVFQAWEKRHGYENKSYVVQETKTYLIEDYIKEGVLILNAPCKGCEYREVACHVKCPAYRMYKRKRETMQDNAIKQNDVLAYLRNNVKKVKHRMRKAKYGCTVID